MKEQLLEKLAQCIVDMEEEEIVEVANDIIENGISADEAILVGLSEGMNRVSALYEEGEYFIPEVVVCADTMYAALDVLKPHCNKNSECKGKVVIGVVEGDTHDIGKNIVAIMLEADGFEIHDLGRDVKINEFVDKAEEIEADIICLSSLMTTTMDGMRLIVEEVKKRDFKKAPRVMVGGAPLSNNFAKKIGADGYSSNAPEAVRLANSLL